MVTINLRRLPAKITGSPVARSFTLVSRRSRKKPKEKLGGTLDYPTRTAIFNARD